MYDRNNRDFMDAIYYTTMDGIPYEIEDESVMKNNEESKYGQEFKYDSEKPKLSLVPSEIIYAIAKIREYGNDKYGDVNGWRKVDWKRYIDAAYRHWLKVVEDPFCIDDESGYPHLWHVACNIAFLCSILDSDLKYEMETYIQNEKIDNEDEDEDEDSSDLWADAFRNDDLRRLSEFIRNCNKNFEKVSNDIKGASKIDKLEDE